MLFKVRHYKCLPILIRRHNDDDKFLKDANKERKFLGLTLTPNKHRLQEYVKYQQEDYETDILEKKLEEIKKKE